MASIREGFTEIKIIARDEDNSLVRLIDYLRIANIGHSFSVVVDPDVSDYKKTFYLDGDGSFRIESITKDGKKFKVKNDKLIEGYLKNIQ